MKLTDTFKFLRSDINLDERILRTACHFDQLKDWSCGISAVQSILKFVHGHAPTHEELIALTQFHGFQAIEEGLSTPHVANLLFWCHCELLQVVISPESLRELGSELHKCPVPVQYNIQPFEGINPLWAADMNNAMRLLLDHNINMTIRSARLKDFCGKGGFEKPLIMKVSCSDYYGLPKSYEDEAHFLALLPFRGSYVICDGYERMGFKDVANWQYHLDNAKRYNWKYLRGDAIICGY